jgi:hypothetical protein
MSLRGRAFGPPADDQVITVYFAMAKLVRNSEFVR